ncbi:MAG: hypothetical protein JW958_14495 [Candidatus Eisenbacteria bacterium]|nr:hypothetical protein [Candidatus Eisenbacteria bacterium]
MRLRWFFLLFFFSLACGDNSSSPPNGTLPVCPDQPYANVNLLAGRLSDQLYDLDVAQVLLMKGATERFIYTIAGHDSSFYRQEVYDLMESSIRIDAGADSILALLDAIATTSDTLDDYPDWGPLFQEWEQSIAEAIDGGRARFSSLTERARVLGLEMTANPSSPEALAMSCRAGEIAPRFDSLDEFIAGATRDEWRDYLPTLPACALDKWRSGWSSFVRAQVDTMGAIEKPFWGPIGLFHLSDILGSEPDWEQVGTWGGDAGALEISWENTSGAGDALAVLLPCGDELSGSYYHPFLMRNPPRIEPVPAGSYRVLLFLSGFRPSVSDTLHVDPGETTAYQAEPTPLDCTDCVLTGGEVDLWVVDPTSDEHINNDFNVPCDTEVWEGEMLFQLRYDLDTLDHSCIVRAASTFRFEVDCSTRAIQGDGLGPVTLIPEALGDYVLVGAVPDSVRIVVSGQRYRTGLEIEFHRDPGLFSAVVFSPTGTEEMRDVSGRVVPGYSTTLQLGTAQSAETRTPPGADETSPFFFHATMRRVF